MRLQSRCQISDFLKFQTSCNRGPASAHSHRPQCPHSASKCAFIFLKGTGAQDLMLIFFFLQKEHNFQEISTHTSKFEQTLL